MDIQKSESAVTVWHGSYGEWTYYDIVQHRYGSTDCEAGQQGYVKVLPYPPIPSGSGVPGRRGIFRNSALSATPAPCTTAKRAPGSMLN